MSLRVDSGRPGRSHSRTRERSRSRAREEPEKPRVAYVSSGDYSSEVRSSRTTASTHDVVARGPIEEITRDDEERETFELRGPSTRTTPGLSSLSGSRRNDRNDHNDIDRNDDDDLSEDGWPRRGGRSRGRGRDEDDEQEERERKYEHRFHERAKHTAKDFENDDALDDPSYFRRANRQSVIATQYPDDGPESPHTSMPRHPSLGDDTDLVVAGRRGNGHSKSAYESYAGASIPSFESQESKYSAQVRESREVRAPREEKRQSSNRLSIGGPKHDVRAPSPSRGGMLSVGGGHDSHKMGGGAPPPPSPLLEAYKGTYQSISPMPSPMMLGAGDDDLDDMPGLDLTSTASSNELVLRGRSKSDAKQKKRVKIYDGEGDAERLADALNHTQARSGPLVEILPDLSHDQLLKLRDEYKKRYKVGGKGVNLSKHIKVKTTGNFGKICFVSSLGRWESESYWANFWYQSHSANRELLIESLMGRTNADIREIKDSFKDKRYNDSLSKCMEKELKPDKFRTAVLLALEARRQEETDVYPIEERERDVEALRRAIRQNEGGESAIIKIVVCRSDAHLREVLKMYEREYQSNFARDALARSNNLVGEVIAHILNGAINRPVRDALLVHHALDDIIAKNRQVELRYELLMSRLIRFHWDKPHLARVKEEYRAKFRVDMERDIKDATKAEFGDFCLRLCDT